MTREGKVLEVENGDTPSTTVDAGRRLDADATWLSRSLLLVVGCPDVSPGDTRATLLAGNDSFEVGIRCISLAGTHSSTERKVVTAAIDDDSRPAQTGRTLSMEASRAEGESGSVELTLTDLDRILDQDLSGLNDADADRVLEFVSAAPAEHGLSDTRDLELSNRLFILRDALRRPLPTVMIERERPLSGNIDSLVAIDDTSFYVQGWIRDGEARIARLTGVTPEGERLELLELLFRLPRPEDDSPAYADGPYSEPVDAIWFVARFETRRPSRLRRAWVFELENEAGRAVEMHALPDVPDIRSARSTILRSVSESALPDEQLMSDHILPAIERLQERVRESINVASVQDYGAPNDSPEISIVVPLYRRIDLLEHQLLQFDRDPEVRGQELIYVLDSPELGSALTDSARQLASLYQVPFRVAAMADNVGFGAATNAGVSLARGRLILLLNSDVLPTEPGWLGEMQAFYDSTSNIGALGVKLLYEDDSLQHAGLYFEMSQAGPTAGSWANMHYYKGLHKDLPAANVARPVPAVTAACLLIEKDLYEQVGALPDVYVQGDYEDSELCVRILAAGRDNWYLPTVELYHLEGSSYSSTERAITASYNRWLQTRRWGHAIEDVMARHPGI